MMMIMTMFTQPPKIWDRWLHNRPGAQQIYSGEKPRKVWWSEYVTMRPKVNISYCCRVTSCTGRYNNNNNSAIYIGVRTWQMPKQCNIDDFWDPWEPKSYFRQIHPMFGFWDGGKSMSEVNELPKSLYRGSDSQNAPITIKMVSNCLVWYKES